MQEPENHLIADTSIKLSIEQHLLNLFQNICNANQHLQLNFSKEP